MFLHYERTYIFEVTTWCLHWPVYKINFRKSYWYNDVLLYMHVYLEGDATYSDAYSVNQDGETKEYKTRLNRIRSYLRKTRGSYSIEEAFEGGTMDVSNNGSSSSQVVGRSKGMIPDETVIACRSSSMYGTYIHFKNKDTSTFVETNRLIQCPSLTKRQRWILQSMNEYSTPAKRVEFEDEILY